MSADRYEIRGKIGQGGVGAVYRAYDTQLRREVAMKRVLQDGEMNNDEATKNLLKEATALSSVQHPHIVTVYDAGIDFEGPYVVMELINGKTLDEMVERGTLTFEDFREVAIQSQEAMIAAQDLDLVHRDLKPSNIMVSWLPSGRFQVKIVDFGLAKFSAKPSLQTIDHGDAVFGSIFFMAPEQFERTPLDKRTDMYSLGALYYYSLTGQYPFNGDTAPQVMAAHLQNKVAPLAEIRPDLPPWVCEWVMWHIRKNMEDRPPSALAALEHFMAHDSSNSFAVTSSQTVAAEHPASTSQLTQGIHAKTAVNTATAATPVLKTANTSPALNTATNQLNVTGSVTAAKPNVTGSITATGQPTLTGSINSGTAHLAGATSQLVPKKKKSPVVLIIVAGIVLLAILLGVLIMLMGQMNKQFGYNEVEKHARELRDTNPTKKKDLKSYNKTNIDFLLTGAFADPKDDNAKAHQNNCVLLLGAILAEGDAFDIDDMIYQRIASKKETQYAKIQFFNIVLTNRANIIHEQQRPPHSEKYIQWVVENTSETSSSDAVNYLSQYAFLTKKESNKLIEIIPNTVNDTLINAIYKLASHRIQESASNVDIRKIAQLYKIAGVGSNAKQKLLSLLTQTGSSQALPIIKEKLQNDSSIEFLSKINKYPNPDLFPILIAQLNVYKNSGSGFTKRKAISNTISKYLSNPTMRKEASLKDYVNEFLENAKNDEELKSVMNTLVSIDKPWSLELMKKAGEQAKNKSVKALIAKEIETRNKK